MSVVIQVVVDEVDVDLPVFAVVPLAEVQMHGSPGGKSSGVNGHSSNLLERFAPAFAVGQALLKGVADHARSEGARS